MAWFRVLIRVLIRVRVMFRVRVKVTVRVSGTVMVRFKGGGTMKTPKSEKNV